MAGKAVALGNFDGLHPGHLAVLEETKKAAGSVLTPCVVLFREHSQKILSGAAPSMLMTSRERGELLSRLGFDADYLDFNEIKGLSEKEFVDIILKEQLNAKAVVCGFNYRFGRGASGTSETLARLCKESGLICRIVGEVSCNGKPVSSTAIRSAIENGEIEGANCMLGRKFGFTATVINGDKRGRTWGFPTVNQLLPDGLTVPKFGVYASCVTLDGRQYHGVTNIGKRPTVGTDIILSETHILDFNEDIYGKEVDVRLERFIRSEQKFNSFDELAAQIKTDVTEARGR